MQKVQAKFLVFVRIRDEWIPLFSDIQILGYLGYCIFLDTWISGYLDIMDIWIQGYLDTWISVFFGYMDTLDIKFFHYPDFGYPIQVSRYFWIPFFSTVHGKRQSNSSVKITLSSLIIRPGCSRLLEFEKKIVLVV